MASGRDTDNLGHISAIVKSVNEPNLFVSPSTALLLAKPEKLGENIELLKNLKFRILLVGAPEKDIYGTLWNTNKPICDFQDKQALKQLISANPECALLLDGLYSSSDEEYKDITYLNQNNFNAQ